MRLPSCIAVLAALAMSALAGCGETGDGDPRIPLPEAESAPSLDAEAVLSDLKSFSESYPQRARNLPDHEGARTWIADQFAAAGLEVYRQNFTDGIEQANIVGIKWGAVRDQWVVVGGHYDMVTLDCGLTEDAPGGCVGRQQSAGAYDDGSGTLLTVHLAQAFAQVDTTYTIAFVAFDGEERGLQGSGAFVKAWQEGALPYDVTAFRAMLDIDMFGLNCPGVDTPVYFDSNSPELASFVQEWAASRPECGDTIEYHGISLGRSDYAHFFGLGVPTGFFISDFEQYQLPGDAPFSYPEGLPAGSPIGYGSAYPFWHLFDTYATMEAMAGSAADLQSGFQFAADLAAAVVHHMAGDAALTGSVVE